MFKKFLVVLLIIVSFNFYSCNKEANLKNIKELVIRNSAVRLGEYKIVSNFYVDYKGNIYIPDYSHYRIDKYSPKGEFLLSFGRKGEGPGEFRYIPPFAVDSEENIYTIFRGKIAVFNKDGRFVREMPMPDKYKRLLPYAAKISPLDDLAVLFVIFSQQSVSFKLIIFRNKDIKLAKEIYFTKRKNLMLKHRFIAPYISFSPSFDFDKDGNILITDIFDYKITVISKTGKISREFSRKCQHEEIKKEDLYIYPVPENNRRLKESLEMARREVFSLDGRERYYPCIFKISVDKGKIYVWTTKFVKGEFIVDIYDTKFKFIEKRKFYNALSQPEGFSFIRNGFFYMVDIFPENEDVKWGKLLFPKIPPSNIVKAEVLQ